MGDSSDTDEFYDAEEFTPIKGSKRSSLCKNVKVPDGSGERTGQDKSPQTSKSEESGSRNTEPAASGDNAVPTTEVTPVEDDRTTVKNVVQGRKRFQELRRCMQTEEEDEVPETGSADHQYALEQPFKIIAHDTMSLQSMTSLGRIGRILSGASESHPNIRDAAPAPSLSSREPSTISDDPLPSDSRNQNVGGLAEPDVIASTKANSLKQSRGSAIVAVAACAEPRPPPPGPVAPPRKKKRNKLHGSQSLSTADGDNLSVCTTDTDDYRYVPRRPDKPTLESLVVEPPLSSVVNQSMALPSPASTIESLTREFQDSLELSHSKYAMDRSVSSLHESRGSERGSGSSRGSIARRHQDSALDIKEAVRGDYVVKPLDDERVRSDGLRTHSEGRTAPTTGTSSLGSATRRSNSDGTSSVGGGRRRSAGDEQQLQLGVRTRTTSGHCLTDMEILEQVCVLNLDTGERVPLSIAEHKLPQCMNPLSLHIMRLTSEYIGRENDEENTSAGGAGRAAGWRRRLSVSLYSLASMARTTRETDEESESVCAGGAEDETKEKKSEATDRQTTAIKRKTEKIPTYPPTNLVKSHSQDNINKKLTHEMNARLKRFFGSTVKKTVDAAKSLAQEVSHARHKEDVADIADDVRGEHNIKLKASNSHKGPYDFDGCVRHVQEMSGHIGAVWCCKLSVCGRLLATAGQDKLLRTWVTRDAYHMFQDMRTKYNAEQKSSPTPSQESLASFPPAPPMPSEPLPPSAPFCPRPFCVYSGHTSDLLDVSWSKNYFLLSSSMDKTVRLWHISRGECLCCFQHIDFVTAIVFHPRDDRYFLSGSLDGKLRLWNIPDKKVAVWNEVDGKTKLITAANFCQNGKFAVVGTYDGRCIFYTTDQLKYHTQIDVRSTRGKNSTGRKISGIEPMPTDDKILVTSNDSRIRLYDLRDLNLSCKYKGYVNVSSQIKASFSHDGKYIVSGSENQCIYIWKTYHDYSKFSSVRRDRNDYWEGIKAHNAVVTCAVFAPNPDHMIRMIAEREEEERANREGEERDDVKGAEAMVPASNAGQVLVSADFNGCIKVFVHKAKPKHSSLPASALA
ncbi:WD repeat-containing protein 44 isoform X2 [Pectinophora gossypiella]|uniref:WD repeat-containing protein 44 isoform X2 n=1 Tax=Pectinophora gossypiella TaxID=13191 RepID=UPI00214E3BDC|nr:WD repeat-containing protein 44 isoform X2 [Pectinophora gossypiella]